MNPRHLQLPPPKSWIEFETLALALFKNHWNDPEAQKNGRQGQAQQGVDVWGSPERQYGTVVHGVQCKGKDANYGSNATEAEVEIELKKAEEFAPELQHWVFATTAPRDAKLQTFARKLSKSRFNAGKFTVQVFGWDDLQELICDHPRVLTEYYPNHADRIPELIETVKAMQTSADAPRGDEWIPVTVSGTRDLGAALIGRKLGPNDASSCPRLVEADRLVDELKKSGTARLFGVPGAGKSVCAYQAALTLQSQGFRTLQLLNSKLGGIPNISGHCDERTLFIVDDAHLMPASVLAALERCATDSTLILSIHNEIENHGGAGGYVSLDPKRAVKTIARSLRKDLDQTLKLVSRVDKRIGPGSFDEDISRRLDHAEETSGTPWQFCFILGGGWSRSGTIADAARAAKADTVLAIAAALQIASRDAIASPAEVANYDPALSIDEVEAASCWLAGQRAFLDHTDCRTPHQRLAAQIFKRVLEGQSPDGRNRLGAAFCAIVSDKSLPLIGIRNLMHEIRFDSGNFSWTRLISSEALASVSNRCWQASSSEEILYATLTLSEFSGFGENCDRLAVLGHESQLAEWISAAADPSGYGIGNLLNSLHQRHEELANDVLQRSDVTRVADAINKATPDTAYSVAHLVTHVPSAEWHSEGAKHLDRKSCLRIAQQWPNSKDLGSFSKLCLAIGRWNRQLAFDMAIAFTPRARDAFRDQPFETMNELRDILSYILHFDDPLGVMPKPTQQQSKIARSYISEIDTAAFAQHFSQLTLRQMQNAASFITFLRKCSKTRYRKVIQALDWDALAKLYENEWASPSHEAEVLLGTFCGTPETTQLTAEFLHSHIARLNYFPPRWALISPKASIEHAAAGKPIMLAKHDHVDWYFGPTVIDLISENAPDQLERILSNCKPALVKTLGQRNLSWFREAEDFLHALQRTAPTFLSDALCDVSPNGARQGWTDCLQNGGEPRRVAAHLIETAHSQHGEIRTVAVELRKHFPRASIPTGKLASQS